MSSPARGWDGAAYDRLSTPMQAMGLEVLDRLPLNGDETVIDAGCGSGRVTEALVERLPRGRVIGVDGSPSMIEAARERLGDRAELHVADLLDLDLEFYLFRHTRTQEDVVVYRRDDGRIGLIFPPGSVLADEGDLVVAEPSRYPDSLTLDAARAEMDELDHRFLYFMDAHDGRGKVLYLRHDGDYGLVEPA